MFDMDRLCISVMPEGCRGRGWCQVHTGNHKVSLPFENRGNLFVPIHTRIFNLYSTAVATADNRPRRKQLACLLPTLACIFWLLQLRLG